MTTYRFSVEKKKVLTCFEVSKGLKKYEGKKALNLLNSLKDNNFNEYKESYKNNNGKKTLCIGFKANDITIIFDDIANFRKTDIIPIDGYLKDFFNIINRNKISKPKRINYTITKLKTIACATLLSSVLSLVPQFEISAIDDSTLIELKQKETKKAIENEYFKIKTKALIEDKYAEDHIYYVKAEEEISDEELEKLASSIESEHNNWDGQQLTSELGNIVGPSGGNETYYDADVISEVGMDKVVENMRLKGFDQENYPYYIRDDGVRMLGSYVMVAANLDTYPRGTIVETSLGTGIVVDTGDFAQDNPYQLDIATNWTRHKALKKTV